MDASFNDLENEIRPPDGVKREQLLEDTRDEFQKEMDLVMNLSIREFEDQQEINRKYEEKILQEYHFEVNNRKEIYKKLLLDLNRIIKFDKEIKEIYDIIEPIIDNYCLQHIQTCELDEKIYEKIFTLLNTIRTDKAAVEHLKTIILKE